MKMAPQLPISPHISPYLPMVEAAPQLCADLLATAGAGAAKRRRAAPEATRGTEERLLGLLRRERDAGDDVLRAWGDMGRYGEIRGDMGRYGEIWREGCATLAAPNTSPIARSTE